MLINEVELSIYKFLTTGAKIAKKLASIGQVRGQLVD